MKPEERGDSLHGGGEAGAAGRDRGDRGAVPVDAGCSAEVDEAVLDAALSIEVSPALSSSLSSLSAWRGGPTRLWEDALELCETSPGEDDGGGDEAVVGVVGGGVWGWALRHRGWSSCVAAAAAVLIAGSAWFVGFNWRGWVSVEDGQRSGTAIALGPAAGGTSSRALGLPDELAADAALPADGAGRDNREFAIAPQRSEAVVELAVPSVAMVDPSARDRRSAILGTRAGLAAGDSATGFDVGEDVLHSVNPPAFGAAPGRVGRADVGPGVLQQQQVNLVVAVSGDRSLPSAFDVVSQRLVPGESIEIRPVEQMPMHDASRSTLGWNRGHASATAVPPELNATINLKNNRAGMILDEIEQLGQVVERVEVVADLERELAAVESLLLVHQRRASEFQSDRLERRNTRSGGVEGDMKGFEAGMLHEPIGGLDPVELSRYAEVIRRIADLLAERDRILNKPNLTNIQIRLIPVEAQGPGPDEK